MVISKADGRSDSITLNKRNGEDENGQPKLENVLDQGNYDIEIDTGPSFRSTKKK